MTRNNTRKIDILASNADGSRSAGIQVKTNRGYWRAWPIGLKAGEWEEPSWFYVFVNLNAHEGPMYYIVDSATVAKFAREKKGNGSMLKFRLTKDGARKYEGCWDRLGLD